MGGAVRKHVSTEGLKYIARNGRYKEMYNRIPENQDPHEADPKIREILERGTYEAPELAEMFPRMLLEDEEMRVGQHTMNYFM